MANGTTDYALGELRARVDNNCNEIIEVKEAMKKIVELQEKDHDYISRTQGSLNMLIKIGVILGALTAVNVTVSFIF